jgi:hypothetical protein
VWNDLIHLLIIAVVILVVFGGRKIKPRKPPTHPLPVTGPIETTLRIIQRIVCAAKSPKGSRFDNSPY